MLALITELPCAREERDLKAQGLAFGYLHPFCRQKGYPVPISRFPKE